MKVPNNIFLVGPMGAGKSTVGRQLAKSLNMEFVDCDREIEERTGVNYLRSSSKLEGEEGFRKRECAMIEQLTERDGIVLATGGGAVLEEDNRVAPAHPRFRHLPQCAHRAAARANGAGQAAASSTNRRSKGEAHLALAEEREPLYQQVADMVVKTDRRTARGTSSKKSYARLGPSYEDATGLDLGRAQLLRSSSVQSTARTSQAIRQTAIAGNQVMVVSNRDGRAIVSGEPAAGRWGTGTCRP